MSKKEKSIPNIVCIGASAGGLEAIEQFFKNCPDNIGVSYVVIQHLSSNYKSMMDDLINRYTSMPITMIQHGAELEENTVYLIEAGTTIELDGNHFSVKPKGARDFTLPIDIFLQSLSDSEVKKAIAVILSGTGSDGSRGALAINSSGGFVIAQEPSEASFDGMPNSVISTGIVDYVLPVKEIPDLITKHLTTGIEKHVTKPLQTSAEQSAESNLNRILLKLNDQFGINFSFYKEATVERRIERRMQVKHIRDYETYANIIETDPIEPVALRSELLIPVTNFFRDEVPFRELKDNVVNKLVKNSKDTDELRIWVAGCSSGEEAYSIAILFTEALRKYNKHCMFKIFATDVNPDIINQASKGVYPDSIQNEVPPNLLKAYFTKNQDNYEIRKELRNKVVFAVHNLLTDAPFTKMDLVTCRNTLIYFKTDAQKAAMSKLQYALKEQAFLFLGKSESLVENENHFKLIDRKNKIYQCISKPNVVLNSTQLSTNLGQQQAGKTNNSIQPPGLKSVLFRAEKIINHEFTPLSLLVDASFEVIHVYGEATDMLRIKPGALSNHIGSLLPEKLSTVALALIYRLNKERSKVSSDVVNISDENKERLVKLQGWTIVTEDIVTHYVISLIEVMTSKDPKVTDNLDVNQVNAERIHQLEVELNATRESLQSTIEELETTNEELQSTNEELMASNEELQSSNEELQSVNEELNTVNAEYHEKMSDLNRVNADLDVMTSSTGFATLFINADLQLIQYTPDSTKLFKVRKQDLGRPLDEIVNTLVYPDLLHDIKTTIKTGVEKECEVKAANGATYLAKLIRFSVPSQQKQGAVLSFVELKAFGQFQSIMDSTSHHMAVLNKEGEIVLVNNAWQKFASDNGGQELMSELCVGANYLNVCDTEANEVSAGINDILQGKAKQFSYKYPCHSPQEKRWFIMTAEAIEHDEYKVVVTHTNVTRWES